MDTRICAFCALAFVQKYKYHKEYVQECCSRLCSNRLKAKRTEEKCLKIVATKELFEEAETHGSKRAVWLAEKLGCTMSHIYRVKKDTGYEWKTRRTTQLHAPTTVERRYVGKLGCLTCGEKRFVDAAHFVAARDGGSNQITNMIPLCPTHHRLYDRGKLFDKELKKLSSFLVNKYDRLVDLSQFSETDKYFKNHGFRQIAAFFAKEYGISQKLALGAFSEVATEEAAVIREYNFRAKPDIITTEAQNTLY